MLYFLLTISFAAKICRKDVISLKTANMSFLHIFLVSTYHFDFLNLPFKLNTLEFQNDASDQIEIQTRVKVVSL